MPATSAPAGQDLPDEAMTEGTESLDDDDSRSDSTEAREAANHPRDDDDESEAEIRVHGQTYAVKQPLTQPLKRRKPKAAAPSYHLRPDERKVHHFRLARQIAIKKHEAALAKWNEQRKKWAKKAKNHGKTYHVPKPVLAPARRVNKSCKLLCFTRPLHPQLGDLSLILLPKYVTPPPPP
jgi:hypothetical protein